MFIPDYINFAFTKDKAPVLGLQNRFLKIVTVFLFLIPAYLYIKKLQTIPVITAIAATLTILLLLLCFLSLKIFLYQRKIHKEIYNEWYDVFGLPDDPKINQKHKGTDTKKDKKEKKNNKNKTSKGREKSNKRSWGKKNNAIDGDAPEEIIELVKETQEQSRGTKKKPKLTRAERKEIANQKKEADKQKRIDKKNERDAKKSSGKTKDKSTNPNTPVKPSKPVKPVRNKG